MNRRAVIGAVVLVAVAIGLWIFAWQHHESFVEHEMEASPSANEAPGAPNGSFVEDLPRVVRDRDADIVLDKLHRDELREKIYRAWGAAVPDSRTDPSTWPTAPSSANGFGKDYVRDRIRADYMPLAKDCYEQGLKKNPSLEGKLVANFRIVGSKNTGGLIDWVDTSSEETTLDDKDVLECLTQSLYSVTFDPPPDDGVVTVTYPMTFSPGPPDAD